MEDKDILLEFKKQLGSPPDKNDNFDSNSMEEQEVNRYKSDTKWRCRLSWWVIGIDSSWLLCVILILLLNNRYLQLDSIVLVTLLGTTTMNVLGLAFIVLKGLFGNH